MARTQVGGRRTQKWRRVLASFSALVLVSMATTLAISVCGTAAASADGFHWSGTTHLMDPLGDGGLTGVSCPSSSFCAAVDTRGDIWISLDPEDGSMATWTSKQIDTEDQFHNSLNGIACTSRTFCLVTDAFGNVLDSTNPDAGTGSTWESQSVDQTGYVLFRVSCVSISLCVAADNGGNVASSTDPADGEGATWALQDITGPSSLYAGVSCPTLSLCVTASNSPTSAFATVDPTTSPSATWQPQPIYDPGHHLSSVSCASEAFCVITDAEGSAAVSTDPGAGASATWTVHEIDGTNFIRAASCPTTNLCVAVDNLGNAVEAEIGGAEIFGLAADVDPGNRLAAVSCPDETLCVATDDEGNVLVGKREPPPPPPPGGGGPIPTNSAPPRIEGTPRVGKELTCSPGAWSGGMPQSYTYTWLPEGEAETTPSDSPYFLPLAFDGGHQLRCKVTARNAAGSATATSAPVSVQDFCTDPPQGPPHVVVVLLEGVDSVSPGETYDPSKVPTYCYTGDRGAKTHFPASLQGLMDNFNPAYDLDDPQDTASMTDALARHGHVLFLPWSFSGAWVEAEGPHRVHVTRSSAADADQTPIPTDAATLAVEVASAHEAWPHAKIVVLAHSLGGLVAEQYWEDYWRLEHSGVARVVSLDGVLNGTKTVGTCGLFVSPPQCPGFSYEVAHFLASLWTSMEWHDPAISGHDHDGAFLPVGTEGDMAYDIPNLGTDSLISQLLFECNGWPIETCTPLSPGFVSPCPSADHAEVKACPGVIDYVDAAVFGSTATASSAGASRSLATSSRLENRGATANSAERERDPDRRLIVGRPWAEPKSPVAIPGGTVSVSGSGFGRAPGTIWFPTQHGEIPGAVLTWSESSMQAQVPTNAVSGPVQLRNSAGEAIAIGAIDVLREADSGQQLHVANTLAVKGRVARLPVVVTRNGRIAPRQVISLFDGYRTQRIRTNGRGLGVFRFPGSGRRSYIVSAGHAWKQVSVRWRPGPSYRLTMRLDPRHPRAGQPVRVVISVKRGSRPARAVPVTLSVRGQRKPLIATQRRISNKRGLIVARFRQPRANGAIVVVSAGGASVSARLP
jgi:hypothetical protein